MRKLYLLILRSYLGPFAMTFLISLFILTMQFLWKYIDDLVGKGLEWYIIAKLLFYASSTFVPLALPLAILLSSLMTFGNLGEHYELVAMKAAGISLRKAMRPLVVLSIIISIAAFYFSNNILPSANLKMLSLLYDVREKRPALNIKEGVFYNGIDGFVIKIGKKERDNKTIRNILIYDHTSRMGNTNITIADSGKMEVTQDKRYLIFTLYNGINYDEKIKNRAHLVNRPLQKTKFREEYRRFDLSAFAFKKTNEEFFKDNYQMMNLNMLATTVDSLAKNLKSRRIKYSESFRTNFYRYSRVDTIIFAPNDSLEELKSDFLSNFEKEDKRNILALALRTTRNIKDNIDFHKNDFSYKMRRLAKHQIEYHKKFTLSFACFLLFFIGAPLGAIIRKGGLGLPVVISIIFFVIFWVVSVTSEKSARECVTEPHLAMWISSAFLFPIGLFLTFKATTDSPLMDANAWKKIFKRIFFRKN